MHDAVEHHRRVHVYDGHRVPLTPSLCISLWRSLCLVQSYVAPACTKSAPSCVRIITIKLPIDPVPLPSLAKVNYCFVVFRIYQCRHLQNKTCNTKESYLQSVRHRHLFQYLVLTFCQTLCPDLKMIPLCVILQQRWRCPRTIINMLYPDISTLIPVGIEQVCTTGTNTESLRTSKMCPATLHSKLVLE